MLKFETAISHLKDDVDLANSIAVELVQKLEDMGDHKFLLSDHTAYEIAQMIKESTQVLELKTYWYFRKRVIGKFVPSQPTKIWLNRKAQPRRKASNVATQWHEGVHFLDSTVPTSFGHAGNDYQSWKEDTAPFYIDMIAEQIAIARITGTPTGHLPEERGSNTRIVTRPTVWSRVKRFFRRIF